ncbi:MAG: SPFH domain-containing protein [Calothrix sp. MO_167.B12]|nr:SPFH domain-containing protein [Calothrix sp. MO_167.B12]
MKYLTVYLRLAILIGCGTINAAFATGNTKAQTLVAPQASTVVFSEISTTAKSLKINQQSLSHQSIQLMAIPQSQPYILAQASKGGENGIIWIVLLSGVAIAGITIVCQKGVIVIGKNEVGIVYKKFAPFRGSLPADKLIALNGEAGYQADTLSSGLHLWYWSWMYQIRKEPAIDIPHGEIGLVIAKDGQPIPRQRMLGKVIDECKDFQDGHGFLKHGGQKGKQMAILTTGSYRINTELFTVITAANATKHGMKPEQLKVYKVEPNKVGIVTTYDGKPIEGEIAGSIIHDNENFVNGEKFINGGGQQGLQEELLPVGEWNLNPWFVQVKQVPVTEIPNGYVGIIKSYVGKTPEKITGTASYQGDLVEDGYKGIWKTPLRPGKYAINTEVQKIEQIPTDNIVLKWSNQTQSKYYRHLPALKVQDQDGFKFDVEVTQFIRVNPEDAPKMLCSVGSIDQLIDEVLKPTVSHYFLTAAQYYEALEFQNNRTDLQESAKQAIKTALSIHNVQAIDTLIGEIDLPDKLTEHLIQRKIAQQEKEKLKVETSLEEERQNHIIAKETAQTRVEVTKHQLKREIFELNRQEKLNQQKAQQELKRLARESEIEARRRQAEVDALSKRLISQVDIEDLRKRKEIEADLKQLLGEADVDVLAKTLEVLGSETYTDIEKSKILAEALGNIKVPLVPQTINSFGTSPYGSMDFLQANPLGLMVTQLLQQVSQQNPNQQLSSSPSTPVLPQTQVNCPKCGSKNPETNNFCNKCGTGLNQQLFTHSLSEPRCPVVLLLDTSSSMSSECINQLIEGIVTFQQELMQDTVASRSIEVAMITFGDSAQVVQDFTIVESLSPPKLVANGISAMGQGIELALNELESRKVTYKNNGIQEHPAWMFLVAGSTPSDNWKNAARSLREAFDNSKLIFFTAVAVQGANMDILNHIAPSDPPVMLNELKFQELFHWLADSLKRVSSSKVGSSTKLPPITQWARIDGLYRQ